MKSNFQYLILAFVVGVATSPLDNHSSGLFKRVLTKDNTCGLVGGGSNNGYTCDPNLAQGGPCCSTNGYCGKR